MNATATAIATKLRPCPFCGGAATAETHQLCRRRNHGPEASSVAISCTKCTARLRVFYDDHPQYDPSDLLVLLEEAWNCRVQTNPVATQFGPVDWWAIIYEDADRKPEFFTEETAARKTFNERMVSWSCHLFRRVYLNDLAQRSQPKSTINP